MSKMQQYTNMMLTSEKIENITGGKLYNVSDILYFNSISVNIDIVKEGDICFTTNPKQWGKKIPLTENKLKTIFNRGAAAAVISDEKYLKGVTSPVLVVENTRKALEQIAFYIRDNIKIKRVAVTGTEGKTGFKYQLHHLLSKQINVHAVLSSANLDVPILCSMASIHEGDEVEIIEVSVANRHVGTKRSLMIKPDISVITEVGFEHLETHGSLQNLIEDKAGIVDGLIDKGICILNSSSKNYNLTREAIYRKKYVEIKTFGVESDCNARLTHSYFDKEKLLWNISADIEGTSVSYTVHALEEYVPIASLAPLLAIHCLGYDVKTAASDFDSFKNSETMGRFSQIITPNKKFKFYDHSHRSSILSIRHALKVLSYLNPGVGGKKIAVIGAMRGLGGGTKKAHEELVPFIEMAGLEKLYTVGNECKVICKKLESKSIFVTHADKYQDVEELILNDIQDNDLIFIKGHHRVWLKCIAEKIYAMGKCHEI
jgi:UDP-N-acetylmuramoyl-tripeptide--D-alanyl-D-alanine ligase